MSKIVDYSKLDRDTIEFLIEEIKREMPKNGRSLVRYGMIRSVRILNDYWLKSLKSSSIKYLDESKKILHKHKH